MSDDVHVPTSDPPSDPEREITTRTFLRQVADGGRPLAPQRACAERDKHVAIALTKLLNEREQGRGSRAVLRVIGTIAITVALGVAGWALQRAESAAIVAARLDDLAARTARIETQIDRLVERSDDR